MMGAGALALAVPGAGVPADAVYSAIAWTAHGFARVPFGHLFVPALPPLIVAIYYGGLAAWAAWTRAAPRPWKPLLALALVAPLALPAFLHRRPPALRVAALDVGRGACVYVEFPDGRNFLFDAGSLDYRDPGASVAAPYLWSRGVTRVDTIFLSHPDADHVNGARSLIERFRIRRLVVPRGFARFSDLPDWARARGLEVLEVERGRMGDVEILGPPVWEKIGREVPPNEMSIVLRAGGLLLTGDIEELGVEELLTQDPRADVWVVPHHGKYHRAHRELAERVGARAAIVPGPEPYASQRVLGDLARRGGVYVTGTTGTVEIDLAADGPRVRTFRP
jgi:competence protein ComEC